MKYPVGLRLFIAGGFLGVSEQGDEVIWNHPVTSAQPLVMRTWQGRMISTQGPWAPSIGVLSWTLIDHFTSSYYLAELLR